MRSTGRRPSENIFLPSRQRARQERPHRQNFTTSIVNRRYGNGKIGLGRRNIRSINVSIPGMFGQFAYFMFAEFGKDQVPAKSVAVAGFYVWSVFVPKISRAGPWKRECRRGFIWPYYSKESEFESIDLECALHGGLSFSVRPSRKFASFETSSLQRRVPEFVISNLPEFKRDRNRLPRVSFWGNF